MRHSTKPSERGSGFRSLRRLKGFLTRPVPAVPLDAFRITTGFLLFAYFFRTLLEAPLISGPDGLIDHKLSLDVFWFTQIGLFRTGMTLWQFQFIFAAACLLSVFLIAGYRVKLSAAILYLIAISTYRWNFLVMYVDDSIMHLLIFWMLVLPVGNTLTLKGWIRNGKPEWERWKSLMVPGFALRCFFFNLTLLYLVAGLWKWTSPMWLDGTALYVIFKLPISYWHEFWGPQHIPLLRLFDYGTLVLEPLIPLMFVLPKGHYAKYLLLVGFLGLHLGSVATLDIPFANIACAATPILIFREELMDRLRGTRSGAGPRKSAAPIGIDGAVAAVMVFALTLAMLSSVSMPSWRRPPRDDSQFALQSRNIARDASTEVSGEEHAGFDEGWHEGLGPVQTVFFGFLWCIGIAQQYQLFNWIDDRNYTVSYRISEVGENGAVQEIDPGTVFYKSTRGVLLRFYIHGVTWDRIPVDRQDELRKSLISRIRQRYCEIRKPDGAVEIDYTLERIDPYGGPSRKESGRLIRFECS